jgi:2-polyprenyl-3-methyl-5-hydroxy-6-metoxy-1,4-benzoquinol methylase
MEGGICIADLNQLSAIYDRDYYEAGGQGSSYHGYTWDRLSTYFKATARHICEHFKPGTLLDVGCAKGYLVKALVDLGVDACGMDASAYAIENAPADVSERLVQGVVQALPYKDAAFDVVTAMDILEHIPEDEAATVCRELLRVSRGLVVTNILTLEIPDYTDRTHITVKPQAWWESLFMKTGGQVLPVQPYYDPGIWWFNIPERIVVVQKK